MIIWGFSNELNLIDSIIRDPIKRRPLYKHILLHVGILYILESNVSPVLINDNISWLECWGGISTSYSSAPTSQYGKILKIKTKFKKFDLFRKLVV